MGQIALSICPCNMFSFKEICFTNVPALYYMLIEAVLDHMLHMKILPASPQLHF